MDKVLASIGIRIQISITQANVQWAREPAWDYGSGKTETQAPQGKLAKQTSLQSAWVWVGDLASVTEGESGQRRHPTSAQASPCIQMHMYPGVHACLPTHT